MKRLLLLLPLLLLQVASLNVSGCLLAKAPQPSRRLRASRRHRRHHSSQCLY